MCVDCLEEGRSTPGGGCCSLEDLNGICCGEGGGSCANSGCCADDQLCHEGLCVACLPEGATPDFPGDCCSKTAENERCCGELGSSCAASGCCPAGLVCHQGNCVDCLVEGASTVDGDLCCSARAVDNVCCGENGDTCANSLCCAGGICSDGACIPCLPVGDPTSSADDCCSHAEASGQCCAPPGNICAAGGCCPGAFCGGDGHCTQCQPTGAACTDTSECCTGECCEGHCREDFNDLFNCGACGHHCTFFGDICQDGQCAHLCIDTTSCTPNLPPAPDIYCSDPTPNCVGFCSFEARYLVCCDASACPAGVPFVGSCGDGGCCCGTCDYQNHVCLH